MADGGIRTPNLPAGGTIAEFLGHVDEGGGQRSLRRFSVESVLGPIYSALQSGVQFSGFLAYTTLESLNEDLAHPQNTGAQVFSDGANNGYYIKTGASGSGSWVFLRPLYDEAYYLAQFDLAAATPAMPIASILTRAADAIGTIRKTSDTSPVQYFTKRVTGAAVWSPTTQYDL
ncbi:hypothetical protein [Tardiphaga sp.]|uniref:hypothetical protein n=1 Tax=Tardiphaga sp. TaxID=1926292 RepID=UPI0026118862|nr:hypothetical protein [Tardiphaga sp.]MDB5620502.1 hypothetical protein [Tardiphaga sp.]